MSREEESGICMQCLMGWVEKDLFKVLYCTTSCKEEVSGGEREEKSTSLLPVVSTAQKLGT